MKNNTNSRAHHQFGMTMVELMIAMSITLFMLSGVLTVYTSSKQVYRMQNNMSRLQENARFALDYITKNIRMAGYVGCLPLQVTGPLEDIVSGATISSETAFSIDEYDGSSWNNELPGTADYVKAGSDILVIKRAESVEYRLVEAMANNAEPIHISNDNAIDTGNVVLISDCNGAEIFTVSYIDANGFITHNPLSRVYGLEAEIRKFTDVIYYIRDEGDGDYALRRRSATTDFEVIEGVDDMQFDIDSPDNDNLSVRVNLLMRSLDGGITATKQQTLQYNGAQITSTDRHIRKVYSKTVKPRNN